MSFFCLSVLSEFLFLYSHNKVFSVTKAWQKYNIQLTLTLVSYLFVFVEVLFSFLLQ